MKPTTAKSLKRKWAAVLAMVMTAAVAVPGSSLGPVSRADAASSPEVLFSSSFEESETAQLQESKLDGDRVLNVEKAAFNLKLPGDVTSTVDKTSITGSTDFKDEESKPKLFDYNTGTKFLTNSGASSSSPVRVIFKLNQPAAITTYLIASANDEPGRDPKAWTLYGSGNGSDWSPLNSQSNITFSDRNQAKTFQFTNTVSYNWYKLEVTANGGASMTQFSELQLATGIDETDPDPTLSPMAAKRSTGPQATWCNVSNVGWTGSSALEVTGSHKGADEAYCNNVIYDGLSIPVTADTNLGYMIFPALLNPTSSTTYGEQISYHLAVDLAFSDGSYLSELGATDQNGIVVSARAQGESKTLYGQQWNQVQSLIGDVAEGKTISKIIISYDKASNSSGDNLDFLTYFDDIKIENKVQETYANLTDYVDTRRGSNSSSSFSRGLIVPMATTPHGFNEWVPMTDSGGHPYNYQPNSNTAVPYQLYHISIDHYPSNWVAQYGTWQFMANSSIDASTVTTGNQIDRAARGAAFKHENEVAQAHYYSVTFDEGTKASGVRMEVTPTDHAAYTRFTFPSDSANRNVIFDCTEAAGSLTFDDTTHSFTAYSDHTNNGSKRMYVYGVFDQAYDSKKVVNTKQGIVSFPEGTDTVTMKLATSFISYEQAKKNLELEISDSDTFDTIKDQTQQIWEDQLGIIDGIEGATEDQLVTFYSNMYRLFSYPILASENAGTNEAPVWKYASPYSGTPTSAVVKDGKMYTINGFWDTYRTCWAAYALLTPTKDTELLNGLVQHYIDQGWVPRWIAPGGTNSMVGTSSDVVFGDAIQKGIQFDGENALKSAIKNASVVSGNLTNGGREGLENSVFLGYRPGTGNQAFSWSMEGYINDYGISQLAAALGKTDEAAYYRNRALDYANLYNPTVGWFMGRNADGTFRTNDLNFNPADWWGDYTETNAYNMAFSVTQDGQGLANLYGGRDKLAAKLDSLFNAPLSTTKVGGIHEEREAREVRIGQYGHSNQPSHHLPYMYNYAGQPWRTQEIVRDVLNRCYIGSSIGQGYSGDEDNGEMSAWYIFSALGFYPVNMGTPEYAIGAPLFKKAVVHLENGKTLTISAPDNSRENIYVQSVKWNGEDYNKNYILHSDLLEGGTLEFTMGSEPSAWGSEESALPTSITKNSAAPSPAADITLPGASVVAAIPVGSVTADTIGYSGSSNVANLVDNTSNTTASFTEKNVIVDYATPKAKKVTMYTITTGSNAAAAPVAVTLYGSGTGKSTDWVKLDERTGLTFEWSKYTRPFAVPEEKQGKYSYYKVVMTSGATPIEIAELELIGSSEEPLSSDVYRVDSQNKLITGVGEETAVAEFKTRFNNSVTVTRNGTEVTTGNVGTGMTVTDSTGTSYTVVIYGDVSGDGKIGAQDIMVIRKFLISDDTSYLNEAQKKAANLSAHKTPNPNDQIDALDIMLLRKHLLGSSSIEQ